MNDLSIFDQYPVGTFFSCHDTPGRPIRFGTIVGIAKTPANELVFEVSFIDYEDTQQLHPKFVYPVYHCYTMGERYN